MSIFVRQMIIILLSTTSGSAVCHQFSSYPPLLRHSLVRDDVQCYPPAPLDPESNNWTYAVQWSFWLLRPNIICSTIFVPRQPLSSPMGQFSRLVQVGSRSENVWFYTMIIQSLGLGTNHLDPFLYVLTYLPGIGSSSIVPYMGKDIWKSLVGWF